MSGNANELLLPRPGRILEDQRVFFMATKNVIKRRLKSHMAFLGWKNNAYVIKIDFMSFESAS